MSSPEADLNRYLHQTEVAMRAHGEDEPILPDEEPDPNLVSYWDVKEPEVTVVWRYGTGHAVFVPGIND